MLEHLNIYRANEVVPVMDSGLLLLLNHDQARRRKHQLELAEDTLCKATEVGLYKLVKSTFMKGGDIFLSNKELPTKDGRLSKLNKLPKCAQQEYLNKHKGGKSLLRPKLLLALTGFNPDAND